MTDRETLRLRFRPSSVRFRLLGESPPNGGTFFYFADSNLFRYTRESFLVAFPEFVTRGGVEGPAFLETFKQMGCYLDDLCLTPVNNLSNYDRKRVCDQSVSDLAQRLKQLRPAILVTVKQSIKKQAMDALRLAHLSETRFHSLPFPSMGHQHEYVAGLANILAAEKGFLLFL